LENHRNIPDLAPTDWPLQVLRYRLGYYKYKDNREVEPVVTQCPVFLSEDKEQKASPGNVINTSCIVRTMWKGGGYQCN